ncbi:MAG TPA: hypothetical protein VE623_00970 [Acidimicrobiales bacterium]|nr:hypothetical protein [Acidimicrobiales bacterium]
MAASRGDDYYDLPEGHRPDRPTLGGSLRGVVSYSLPPVLLPGDESCDDRRALPSRGFG